MRVLQVFYFIQYDTVSTGYLVSRLGRAADRCGNKLLSTQQGEKKRKSRLGKRPVGNENKRGEDGRRSELLTVTGAPSCRTKARATTARVRASSLRSTAGLVLPF